MSDQNQILFDAFPGAAVHLVDGNVAAANPMAQHYLPQLKEGAPLPFALPLSESVQTGTFTTGLSTYNYRLTPAPQGQWLLFAPAPQTALTDAQLEGALRQLRTLLSQFLSLWDRDAIPNRAATRKTYHQAFRLLDNLDSLRLSAQNSLPFHPVSMDLAGLCRQLIDCTAPLLAPSHVNLCLRSAPASLLIPGDPQLLQRLLLELISNAVRSCDQQGGGTVALSLSVHGGRAMLVLAQSGDTPSPRQLAAMLQQDSGEQIPMPGAGAGLGMALARHITALHQGTLLVSSGEPGAFLALSLPTGPMPSNLTLQTPRLQTDGGLSPLLVGLADVLPTAVFQVEDPN